jgi:predicted nucleic acid-binding protein
MTFLPDTTAFSELMRENPKMKVRRGALPPADRVVICSIVRGEIRYGITRLPEGKRRLAFTTKAARLFNRFECESVPATVGGRYAEIRTAAERKGTAIAENDLWIAATAMTIDATLVTQHTDFHGIDGLRVEDWTA